STFWPNGKVSAAWIPAAENSAKINATICGRRLIITPFGLGLGSCPSTMFQDRVLPTWFAALKDVPKQLPRRNLSENITRFLSERDKGDSSGLGVLAIGAVGTPPPDHTPTVAVQ